MSVPDAVLHVRGRRERPWLVLGKGPSFARHASLDLSGYDVFAISDTGTVVPAAVIHFTDVEAFARCSDRLVLAAGTRVCLPWHPHLGHKPTHRTLVGWLPTDERLLDLYRDGRLLSYNSTVACKLPKHPTLSTVSVRLFSGVAAVSLLAAAGVKTIRTLGLDGGAEYAPGFDKKSLGANGRPTFAGQAEAIARIVRRHGIDYAPLG